MKVEMVMPQMGESITEATISRWLKNPGDAVAKDEIILEISTDKVDSEIPAPAAGVLVEVLYNEGDVVPVKEVIARIDTEGAAAASNNNAASSESAAPLPPIEAATPAHAAQEDEGSIPIGDGKFISPLVKSLAEKHGIPSSKLASITGTGTGGRVTKVDFLKFIESTPQDSSIAAKPTPAEPQTLKSTAPAPVAAAAAIVAPKTESFAKPAPTKSSSMPTIGEWGPDGTKLVPMDAMRQAIAEHMVRSKRTSPHVYSIQEVDVTNISNWRQKFKSTFQKQEGFNLTITPFFLEAAIQALKAFPVVNSTVVDKAILYKRHINLGCAVALPNAGLIVPVIRRAEEKNLVGLARSLNDMSLRARDKKLLPDDVQGGTFTVTNVGGFGTIIGTPIISQPQAGILCIGAAKKRPVVINDMIAIREMCYLTLSYDHRIIDGAIAGQFLKLICDYLEGWDMERTPF